MGSVPLARRSRQKQTALLGPPWAFGRKGRDSRYSPALLRDRKASRRSRAKKGQNTCDNALSRSVPSCSVADQQSEAKPTNAVPRVLTVPFPCEIKETTMMIRILSMVRARLGKLASPLTWAWRVCAPRGAPSRVRRASSQVVLSLTIGHSKPRHNFDVSNSGLGRTYWPIEWQPVPPAQPYAANIRDSPALPT